MAPEGSAADNGPVNSGRSTSDGEVQELGLVGEYAIGDGVVVDGVTYVVHSAFSTSALARRVSSPRAAPSDEAEGR